jgi:hypothetical protein
MCPTYCRIAYLLLFVYCKVIWTLVLNTDVVLQNVHIFCILRLKSYTYLGDKSRAIER